MTSNPRLSLLQLRLFLERKGWRELLGDDRMRSFAPPSDLGLPEDYQFYLPRSDDSASARTVVARATIALADIYGLAEDEIVALAAASDAVLAIQLISRDFSAGSVPFLSFESMVEKLRKTLLHSAAFVLSAGPTIEGIPDEALEYLSRCRFLQTAVGSYIARIQLPQGAPLLEATLFEEGISSSEVSETLVDALSFVSNRVFADDATLYTDEGFENDAEEINLDVFRDIGELLEKSRAESVNFSLTSADGVKTVSTGRLTAQAFQRLDKYMLFAKSRLAADREIDVIGRIVELRSRRPDRRRNHVGVSAILDDREVFIALKMSKQDYPYAVTAHNRNNRIRLRAAVRRMKTQLRVVRLDSFEELEQSADSESAT